MERSEFVKTEGGRLLMRWADAAMRCFEIPNEKLPEKYRDNRTDAVSLATLRKKCQAEDELCSNYEHEKREKARRVEIYRKQVDNGEEISYVPYY